MDKFTLTIGAVLVVFIAAISTQAQAQDGYHQTQQGHSFTVTK